MAGLGRLYTGSDSSRPPGYPDDSFTSSWSVISPTLNVDVWAGAYGPDPTQGFLLVVAWNSERTSILWSKEVSAPSESGALRIVGATGALLQISSATGLELSFDAAVGVFQ